MGWEICLVVGRSLDTLGSEAFIWDAANGMRNLRELLALQGDDVAGWRLTSATGISADGSTIVGYGLNPEGNDEAWVAQLNVVPEPSAMLLAFAALGLVAGWFNFSRRDRHRHLGG